MLAALLIRSKAPCAVCTGGTFSLVTPREPLVIPAAPEGDVLMTVWDPEQNGEVFSPPRLVRIRLEGGRPVYSNIPVVDWGDVTEAEVKMRSLRLAVSHRPELLDSADFIHASKPAKAELYSDNGLGLMLSPRGGQASYFGLGEGSNGRLRVLDMGSKRVLAVTADTAKGRRLIVLGPDAEILLDEEGTNEAGIYDGLPSVIDALDSVRGLEKRTRFELEREGFVRLEPEYGFFTHEERIPSDDARKALAAAEDAAFGLDKQTQFMAPELKESLGEGALKDFLGEYSRAMLHPMEEREGRVTVGLTAENGSVIRPRRFVFAFEDGLISDIEEL